MANKPFDYTVINPLERPTSSDLNQLQGEAHADSRFLAQELFYTLNGISNGPTDGVFPQSFIVTPTSPASLAVVLGGGLGYQTGAAETAIGGIAGLNDDFTYKSVYLSQAQTLPVPTLPTAGNHRYDLIQVRALAGSERLTDSTVTDIYNPSLNSFSGASRYKTLTTDLTGQAVQVIAYTGTPTSPLSYVVGQEVATSINPPPVPPVASGYLPIALVLVSSSDTAISASQIVDQRLLLKLPVALVPSGLSDFGDPGSVVYSTGSEIAVTAQGTAGYLLQGNGASAPSWIASVPATSGGTGITSYVSGDLLYANSGSTLAKLPAGTSGQLLVSGTTPAWLAAGTSSQILRGGSTPSWGTVPTGAFANASVPLGALQSVFNSTAFPNIAITSTSLTQIASAIVSINRGSCILGVCPTAQTTPSGGVMSIRLIPNTTDFATCTIQYRITLGGSTTYYSYDFSAPPGGPSDVPIITLPPQPHFANTGATNYTIAIFAAVGSGTLAFTNCSLYVQQG